MYKHLLKLILIPHFLFSGNTIGPGTVVYLDKLRNRPYTVYSSTGDYLLKTTAHGISVQHTPCEYIFLPWNTVDKIITNKIIKKLIHTEQFIQEERITIIHTDENKPNNITLNLASNQLPKIIQAITTNQTFTPYQISKIKPFYTQSCETFLYYR